MNVRRLRAGLVVMLLGMTAYGASAQKWYTRDGNISFYSKAPLEEIKAVNRSVTAVIDTRTGNIQFSMLMKGFEFQKALMQEHFNENYVESDKWPKASFTGRVVDNGAIGYAQYGTYKVDVKGDLTMHGVTKNVLVHGEMTVRKEGIKVSAVFSVLLSDYQIAIPSLVSDKISRSVQVTVDGDLNNMLN